MSTQSLKSLLDSVHQKKIVLPQFQRDFVWPNSAVMKLMTSIFNGYPIGALLLMENNGAYDYRLLDGVIANNAKDFPDSITETDLVLDGQQRLTSCYRAFYGTLEPTSRQPGRYYFNYKMFIDASSDGDIPEGSMLEEFFEFKRAPYVSKHLSTAVDEQKAGLFPLDIIFSEARGVNYNLWLSNFSISAGRGDEEKLKLLTRVASIFQTRFIENVTGYQVNFEKIVKNTNPDVICTIFETINTTGVKLTVFDLLVAKCFKKDIRLRDKLEEALEQYHWINKIDPEGDAISVTQIPRILGMLIRGECKKGMILSLDPQKIGERWDQAVAALDKALRILYQRYGCIRADLIPSPDAITPLALIVSEPRFSLEIHSDKLDRWYWSVVFSQYLAGAPESKIAKTYREWLGERGWIESSDAVPDVVKDFQFRPSSIDNATKNSAIYKGLMSLMISKGPIDIGIDSKAIKSVPETEVHDHHIFPQKFLHTHGIKGGGANQISNRMPIWKATNESISNDSPHVYFQDRARVGALEKKYIERTFFFDLDMAMEEFSRDGYELFCLDRKGKFLTAISEAVRLDREKMVQKEEY